MCGICGIYRPGGVTPLDTRRAQAMNYVLRHRGPDDEGLFSGQSCVLGHRRLSIIDLSRDGHQPFASPDGRYQLVYNGEIYNYIELRRKLTPHFAFRTRTDTEVLLAAYQCYGPACLNRLNGMFAFAIYDREAESLFLARDRFGIKPLYYAARDGGISFASEIKALMVDSGLSRGVNEQSLFEYLVFNRTDIQDETFLTEVSRLPKGCFALADRDGLRVTRWWSPLDHLDSGNEDSPEVARQKVEELLVSSVGLRMRSDVPVGACLSGGLDSSVLVGILYSHNDPGPDFQTFSAVFPGLPLDESAYVDALARRYHFRSRRTSPSAADALAQVGALAWTFDEPTTGFSFFAQHEVMRLAKAHGVVVLLDGQGGDESFAGYQYLHGYSLAGLWKQRRMAELAASLLRVVARRQERSALETFAYLVLPEVVRTRLLLATTPNVSRDFFWDHIQASPIQREFFTADSLNMGLARHFQYKLEHLLRTEDRNSMAFSLEARLPYLDYRLVEYLLGLPGNYKLCRGETKLLQKQALGHYSLPEIVSRKDKIGFAAPGGVWMANAGWRSLVRESYAALRARFPHVFRPGEPTLDRADRCWKFVQTAAWLDVLDSFQPLAG
mgnify:CR=1 FL=1